MRTTKDIYENFRKETLRIKQETELKLEQVTTLTQSLKATCTALEHLYLKFGTIPTTIKETNIIQYYYNTIEQNNETPIIFISDNANKQQKDLYKNSILEYARFMAEKRHLEDSLQNLHVYLSINYLQFKFVLNAFNVKIIDKVIEGYRWQIGSYVGSLLVVKKPNIVGRSGQLPINWGESLKRKKEIESKGQIPYDKKSAPAGIKWLVYFDQPFNHLFKWSKTTVLSSNTIFFTFQPVEGANNLGTRLNKYIRENPEITNSYYFLRNKDRQHGQSKVS